MQFCSVISNMVCVCVYVCLQRITGSTLGRNLRMFGQSLSSGIDIDHNGYMGNLNCHNCIQPNVLPFC